MHELAITHNILNVALDEAKAVQAKRITQINLRIGELSGVVTDSVQFYFDFLSKDSIAEGSMLSFELIPTQLKCRHCLTTFNPKDILWNCPNCQSQSIEIISGRDFLLESLEVDQ